MYGTYLLQAQGSNAVFLLLVEGASFSCELLQRTSDHQLRRTKLCNMVDCSTGNKNLVAAWLQVMTEFITAPPPASLRCGKSHFVDQHQPSYRLRNVVTQGDVMYKVYDSTQLAARSLAAAEAVYRSIIAPLSDNNERSPAQSSAGPSPLSSAQPAELSPGSSLQQLPATPPVPSAQPAGLSPGSSLQQLPARLPVAPSSAATLSTVDTITAKVAVQRAQRAAALYSCSLGVSDGCQTFVAAALAAQQSLEAALVVARLRQGAADGLTLPLAQQVQPHSIRATFMEAVYAAELATASTRVNYELINSFYPGPTEIILDSAGRLSDRLRYCAQGWRGSNVSICLPDCRSRNRTPQRCSAWDGDAEAA